MHRNETEPKTLILIKHALPQIDPMTSANTWPLCKSGRANCSRLADALARWSPRLLISSSEPKAMETARITAERLAVPWTTAPGLHEHDRSSEPYFADEAVFQAKVAAFFAEPEKRVFGAETAHEALTRFAHALDEALANTPERSVAVVAHGTVISLYAAHRYGIDGFTLWRRLGLPSFIVIDAPALDTPLVIEKVD